MLASASFSSVSTALKNFAKQQGHDGSILLEIHDIDLLIDWQGKLVNNFNYVYNPWRQETKAQEGLRYYIDFLRNSKILLLPRMLPLLLLLLGNIEVVVENEIESVTEGMMKEVIFFRLQRNRAIRKQYAEKSHCRCYICGFDFEKVYGERGHEFIEVHHLIFLPL